MKQLKYTTMLMLPLLLLFCGLNSAFAQEADKLSSNAVEARGDIHQEEIHDHEMMNTLDAEFDAPAYKVDEDGERAAARFVKFDNYTNWYVRCYINGVLQGTMAPWGSLTIYLPRADTYRLYAVAPFSDGPDKVWGGINRYVSGSFTWSLYP